MLFKIFQSGASQWFTGWQVDEQGRRVLRAESSAVSGYDEDLPGVAILKADAGLIHISEYYPFGNGGQPAGYLRATKLKEGTSGTTILLKEWEYATRALGLERVHPVARETTYQSTDGALAPTVTEWTYDEWYPDTFQIKQRTTILPVIPEGQNGSGMANQFTEIFDEFGNQTWLQNEREFLTHSTSDPVTGALIRRIEDVDTAILPAPNGWTTPTGGGLHLISDYESDDLGRETQRLEPETEMDVAGVATPLRPANWTVHEDSLHRVLQGAGYATGTEGSYVYALINPVSIAVMDLQGRVTDSIVAIRASTSGRLSAGDEFPQADWCRWRKTFYNNQSRKMWARRYVLIPATGDGIPGVNYNEASFGYDVRGRENRTTSPGGTIRRSVLDARSLVMESWVGTNDTGATAEDPSGSGSAGNNMVKVVAREFDDSLVGRDGNLTEVTTFPAADDPRVTAYGYDFRNRRVIADGEVDFFEKTIYDNLDRAIRVDRHDTTAEGTLIGRNETGFDNLGRTWSRTKFAVNIETGAVGKALVELTWHDPAGNLMRIRPMNGRGCTKRSYDGINRVIRKYAATDPASGSYERAGSVANDIVIEQTETAYDGASNVIATIVRRRFHDATGLGELNGPNGAQPRARVSYLASYPDPLGREIAMANYGTNGASAWSRSAAIPTPSDAILVSRQAYNDRGEPFETTDPMGKVDSQTFDDAGQVLETVENDRTTGSGPDIKKTTRFAYNADGHLTVQTAANADTGDQVTQFIYGTSLGESHIASNDLMRRKILPDGGFIDFGYDATGAAIFQIDQNGTRRDFHFDKLGRSTDDCAVTLGSGVDGTVRRISKTYEVRGMLEFATSASDPTPGAGTVVNQVQMEYDDFGQVLDDYQGHDGAVDTATTPKVHYAYADGTNNTARRTAITYPNGRVIGYTYGAVDSPDDLLNRITNITSDGISLVQYARLGVDAFVQVQYQEPGYELTFIKQPGESDGDAGDQYTGLDRFDRATDFRWLEPGSTPLNQLERVIYGFDRASNSTWRKEAVAPNGGFDEQYTYDGLYQLKTRQRGTLSGGTITNVNQAEVFTYDPTGNWPAYELTESGIVILDQARTHNQADEITSITNLPSTGVATTYDPSGNMTTMPSVRDWTTEQTLTWDPWNRLVEIKVGSTVIGRYQYDGLTRRTRKHSSTGENSELHHYYFSEAWQILEERVDAAVIANRQFLWGLRSMDDIVLRECPATSQSRLYAVQDQWSVTGLTDDEANVQERYAYLGFGENEVITSDFAPRLESLYDWEIRFCCYHFDSESHLSQVRYRYYSSTLGRWLSRDPLGAGFVATSLPHLFPEAAYLYSYNSSPNAVDPYGLKSDREKCLEKGDCWEWVKKKNGESAPIDGCSAFNFPGKGDKNNPTGKCSFKDACDNHDKCYRDCSKDLETCNDNLYNEMNGACDKCKLSAAERRTCKEWAERYITVVKTVFGEGAYNKRQGEQCECKCNKEKAK